MRQRSRSLKMTMGILLYSPLSSIGPVVYGRKVENRADILHGDLPSTCSFAS